MMVESYKPTKFNYAKELKVFITGLALGTSLKKVTNYFSSFGDVEVTFQDIGYKNKASHSGACVVQTFTKPTFSSILNNLLVFEGRVLHSSVYREGKALLAHNSFINKRRVVLKKVPGHLSLEQVKHKLEVLFGSVESIHTFKPTSASTKCEQKGTPNGRKKSFSVLFSIRESAVLAIQYEKISFGSRSDPGIIEKFKRNYQPQSGKQISIQDSKKTGTSGCTDLKRSFDEAAHIIEDTSSRRGAPFKRIMCEISIDDQPFEMVCINPDESRFHSAKPTSISYIQYRESKGLEEHSTTNRYISNVKFNIPKRTVRRSMY